MKKDYYLSLFAELGVNTVRGRAASLAGDAAALGKREGWQPGSPLPSQ